MRMFVGFLQSLSPCNASRRNELAILTRDFVIVVLQMIGPAVVSPGERPPVQALEGRGEMVVLDEGYEAIQLRPLGGEHDAQEAFQAGRTGIRPLASENLKPSPRGALDGRAAIQQCRNSEPGPLLLVGSVTVHAVSPRR